MFLTLVSRPTPGLPAACLLALLLTAPAQAQTAAAASHPDPLDPRAAVSPLRHDSSLAGYRRLTDEPSVAWREANDTVGRLGGWRAYAREAQRTEPGTPSATAARPAPAPEPATPPSRGSDHSGHHGHGAP